MLEFHQVDLTATVEEDSRSVVKKPRVWMEARGLEYTVTGKVARSLRTHRALLLNWCKARGQISAGAVEGLNNKAKLTTKKAYGFRTYRCLEIALYHTLGHLPEPESAHRFC